jgi:autotransporter-associated beta strand protein
MKFKPCLFPTGAATKLILLLGVMILAFSEANAQRQMEKLGRGVIAVRTGTASAYIGWRLLATDPDTIGFNVLRSVNGGTATQLNSTLITNTTDFTDTTANFAYSNAWFIQPVVGSVTQALSAPWGQPANAVTGQYVSIPLHNPGGAAPPYDVKFCWVGDLDGDGEYDFVVDRMSTTVATNEFLQAYKRDGTFLWQMDMGYNSTNQYNIEPGASAISIGDKDDVTVYDLDGDGRAEVCVRTARGVILPDGSTITGPDDTTQYLSILDGLTGKELARAALTNLWPGDGPMSFRFGIMYCDGVRPSLVMEGENRNAAKVFQRESMTYDYRNGQLTCRWFFTPPTNSNLAWAHSLRIADVNHDGVDELVEIGSVRNGADGTTLFDTELLHGDRFHTTDMDPDRPGLETYSIQQLNPTLLATLLYEAGTGKIIKKWYAPNVVDVGRGDALDMDPRYRGVEVFSTQPGIYDCKGNFISNSVAPFPTLGIWWDADLQREMFSARDGNGYQPCLNKWDYLNNTANLIYNVHNEGVHTAYGGRPAFFGDILGDWREEFIVIANDYSSMRIYTTTIPATNRLYCLMQNPEYRDQCTAKGYYQASYPDYYLGEQMLPPPLPPVSDAKLVWRGGVSSAWDTSTANWFTNNLWISNNTAVAFSAGDTVLFGISGSNSAAISLTGTLSPGAVTVHSPKDYTFTGGSLAGTMTLTKAGAGKLIFNNTNTYSGRTLICESPFLVNGALSNSPVTIRGGVWLDGRLGGSGVVAAPVSCEPNGGISPGPGTNAPGTLTIAGSLTLKSSLNDFDLSDDATGVVKTNDLLAVTGNLTLLGTNTLTIQRLDATLPPGIYPLINYSGALSGGLTNFAVAGLDGIPLALTNPPGQIALVIKSVRAPASLVWAGGQNGNTWDLVTTSNFLNGATRDFFVPQDSVTFNDSAGANTNVTLSGTLVASNLVVNSASNYVFSGSGGIGGGGLTKTNSGTLVVNTDNSYTGRTVIGGGVLEVNDLSVAGSPGPLGSAPNTSPTNLVLGDGATWRINATQAYTDRGVTLQSGTNTVDVPTYGALANCSGLITGGGTLQKIGQGTFILGTSNSYSGGTLIKTGVLQLATEAANTYGFGTGLVTLDGGILKMLDDSSTYSTASYNLYVPSSSTGELDCDSRIDFYGSLTGGGTLKMCIPYVRTTLYGNWSAFTGKINVLPGSAGDSRTGGTGTNGDFRVSNAYGYSNCAVYLTNWMYAYHTTASTTVAVGELSGEANSFLTAGAWQVGAKNTDATFAGHIAGTSVTKVGTGAWTLTGSNYYTGPTTVSAGKLLVNGDSHAATGAITVASGATLGGTGIIGGATTVNGTLSPGSNAIGTLTFTNSVNLNSGGTTYIEIRKLPKTNDLLRVLGRLTYGGALSVTNLAGTLTNGDSFKILDATNDTGAFATLSLPALGSGLGWNTSALYTNGTLSVVMLPRFNSVGLVGTNVVMSGNGGMVGSNYYVLASTNLLLPLAQWQFIATNQFDTNGNFTVTNLAYPNAPQRFYLLQLQ